MNRQLIVSVFVLLIARFAIAQSILVNPDGTHSVIHDHGATSIVVNPNGTHSVLFNNGSTSIMVNPDGTHSAILKHGNTGTVVHPNGIHGIFVTHGDTHMKNHSDTTTTQHRYQKKKEVRVKQTHKMKRKTRSSSVIPMLDSFGCL
jgi:hypothetical protein